MSNGTGTPWWKEIGSVIVGHPLGQFLTDRLKEIFDKAVTPADARYIRFKLTGSMPLEDENLVLKAKAEFIAEAPNLSRVHTTRISGLAAHMQDYYRLTLVGYPDPDQPRAQDERYRIDWIKRIMRRHALMTDTEWQQEVVVMNYNQQKAEGLFKRIRDAAKDIDTDICNTGLPQLTSDVRRKLTDRVRKQLKI